MPTADFFTRLPKVELHLHLEGAIPLDALWTLVQKHGGHVDVPDPEALAAKFTYRDFPHFIDTWVWKNQFLRHAEDFAFIAEAVARDLARQNIRYVEAFYSPLDFHRTGLSPQVLTEAIRAGLDRVPEVTVRLVADLVRDFGPEHGAPVLEAIREVMGLGVIGIGIGGSEHGFPPEPYAALFARARAYGLRTNAHAGEAAGPDSIWGAIRALKVDRIGHGTRAIEDLALIAYLAETGLPLECCPLSNVRTGVAPSLEAHPIKAFIDAGLHVTVNTDDPAKFNNDLAGEYRALAATFDLDHDGIRRLALNAVEAAWLDEGGKVALREAPRCRSAPRSAGR